MKLDIPDSVLKFITSPVFLVASLLRLLYNCFTEPETMFLAIFAVAISFKLGWLWGVIIFLGSYNMVRIGNDYISLLSSKIQLLASALARKK